MPEYWEPGEPGLGIPITAFQTLVPRLRMTRTAQTALAQGATMDQARQYAVQVEQERTPGVTTVRSRIVGGVETVPQVTGGSVFGRAARRVLATRPRVSQITTAVPSGREEPGMKVSTVNGVKVPTAIINGIRAAELKPSVPPPGPLQQPYGTTLIREGLEKLFGPRQMNALTPQAPPGTMPKVAEAGLFAPDAMQKMLPIAVAGIGAWLLFRML